MNEVLLLITLIVYFGTIIMLHRLFGEKGIFAFIPIASIMANIEICIGTTFFNIPCTLGNVAFASIFLCVDILNEKYGEKEAFIGVKITGISMIFVVLISSLNRCFIPSNADFASNAYATLFSFTPRINISSLFCFILAISLNAKIFNRIKKKTGSRMLWLRNNLSTIITNCSENFLLYFMAFGGTIGVKEMIACGASATLIELIIALLDTPFLYLAVSEEKLFRRRKLNA